MKQTLYIKSEQCVEVKSRDVVLGNMVTMECSNPTIVAKLKTLKITKFPDTGKHRYVVSVLKIIELIHKEYPDLEIQSFGSPDTILIYEQPKTSNKMLQGLKVFLVTVITFVGAAFAIMTFNNDSGTSELFHQIYKLFMGKEQQGFSILELTYSIGLAVGILAFFNHFGKRRFTADPTPIEVEMRLYENDIQTTVIADYSRKGQEADVGKPVHSGNHRA